MYKDLFPSIDESLHRSKLSQIYYRSRQHSMTNDLLMHCIETFWSSSRLNRNQLFSLRPINASSLILYLVTISYTRARCLNAIHWSVEELQEQERFLHASTIIVIHQMPYPERSLRGWHLECRAVDSSLNWKF